MIKVSIGVKDQQLERVSSIQYLVKFKKDHTEVQALLDSGSKVNAMTPAYTAELGLRIRPTNVRAEKINGSTLSTHGIVLAHFQLEDK